MCLASTRPRVDTPSHTHYHKKKKDSWYKCNKPVMSVDLGDKPVGVKQFEISYKMFQNVTCSQTLKFSWLWHCSPVYNVSCSLVSVEIGQWFQDTYMIPNSLDAQVPYKNGVIFT
jgi:hypothetical protein